MIWIPLALLSAILTSTRYLYIKKWCGDVPSEMLVMATRVFGSVILCTMIIPQGIHISAPGRFFPVVCVTVILTMIATIATIRIVQSDSLSRNVPYLSFIPIFMIPWTVLLFHEFPRPVALGGILLACSGAYLLNIERTGSLLSPLIAITKQKNARIMLLVAVALGCTTACDKIAISSSSAVTYAFIWTTVSAVIMILFTSMRHGRTGILDALRNKHLLIQAVLWAGSFLTQMAGVQNALAIPSGVTYVKTLTLVNVIFTVAAGGAFFGEQRIRRSLLASGLMIIGAIVVVMGI